MDDLDYEKHLESYKRLFGCHADSMEQAQKDLLNAAEEQAKHHHAICIFDPVRDLISSIASVSSGLSNRNGKFYLLYGAARRANLIFGAYQEIRSIAYEERIQPLAQDDQVTLSQAINNIYIHLLGILDNFAWCLLYERQAALADQIHRNDVGLFSKKFRKQFTPYSEMTADIETHDEWYSDVKERRAPVAHRIPLYVPPAALTPEQAEQYSAISNRLSEQLRSLHLDEADKAMNQLDSIGSFLPYFLHHPDELLIPIYPTIPTDLSHLIRIWRAVSKALQASLNQER